MSAEIFEISIVDQDQPTIVISETGDIGPAGKDGTDGKDGEAGVAGPPGSTGASVVLQFDDGYADNVNALDLAIQYGVKLVMYVDVYKINGTQFGQAAATIGLIRDWIEAGCEIGVHPNFPTDAAATATEYQLIRDLVTGLKSIAAGGVVTTNGSMSHPQYASWRPISMSYQGGVRSDTTDRHMRHYYKFIRTITGTIASRGDVLYVRSDDSEKTILQSGTSADTFVDGAGVTLTPLANSLSLIRSIAATGSQTFLYFHGTPIAMPVSQPSYQAPFILRSQLETLIQACRTDNVKIVTHEQIGAANLYRDFRFDDSLGQFLTNAGDSAGFVTGPEAPYLSASRFVRLTATAFRSNTNTTFNAQPIVVKPFCRYRVRMMYRIPVDLVLNGGTGNWNHGLEFIFQTFQGNTANSGSGAHRYASVNCQNNRPSPATLRLPYLANGGAWQEFVGDFLSLAGQLAQLRVSLFNCTGTVDIGDLQIEEMESLSQRSFGGSNTFDTSLGRLIGLPTTNLTGEGRQWDWDVIVSAPLLNTAAGACDIGLVNKIGDGSYRVFNNAGNRSGQFFWSAIPRGVG